MSQLNFPKLVTHAASIQLLVSLKVYKKLFGEDFTVTLKVFNK